MRRPTFLAALTLIVLGGVVTAPASADPPPSARGRVSIARATSPITLDGTSSEEAWERSEPLRLNQLTPVAGANPTERTELLLTYDDRYLYVAGRMFDSEPSKIQSTTKKRDSDVASAEWFGIVIDTFNDKENGVAFFTTPAGLRWDAAIRGDTGLTMNLAWNADWDVAISRDSRGWFAEFRIPLSSLRFQDVNGQVVMGVISWRMLARKNEVSIYPQMPDTWGLDARFKVSQAQEVVLEGLVGQRPFYFSPYALAGARSGAVSSIGSPREFGLDAKVGLTSNLTLDLTVNPDFAQAEADDVQVNLTRFALFYPEKRTFFQERNAVFDFDYGGSNAVFYSRRVGFSGGAPVRIFGGARLVGRIGEWDVGAIDLQQASASNGQGANIGVVRVRRRVVNQSSYVGGILASRLGTDGSSNVTYGADSLLKVAAHDYVDLKVSQSVDSAVAGGRPALDSLRGRINWERRKMVGLAYGVGAAYSGRDYLPRLGFEDRRDYSSGWAAGYWGWSGSKTSAITLHRMGADTYAVRSNSRGLVESADTGVFWGARMRSGFVINVSPRWSFEDVPETFPLSETVVVPAGRYTFGHFAATVQTPAVRVLRADIAADIGRMYDGNRLSLELAPSWQASPDFELGGSYALNRVEFGARRQTFDSHLIRMRASWIPTTSLTLSALIQRDSARPGVAVSTRLRYNPREGVDLWLVYDRTGSADADPTGLASALKPSSSTFLVKYTYSFRMAIENGKKR